MRVEKVYMLVLFVSFNLRSKAIASQRRIDINSIIVLIYWNVFSYVKKLQGPYENQPISESVRNLESTTRLKSHKSVKIVFEQTFLNSKQIAKQLNNKKQSNDRKDFASWQKPLSPR